MSPLWFAVAAALGNLAGAVAVVRSLRRELRVIDACLAFGAGFMLAVAVLGVLPEVLREGEGGALYVLGGYLAVHLAQHVFTPLKRRSKTRPRSAPPQPPPTAKE